MVSLGLVWVVLGSADSVKLFLHSQSIIFESPQNFNKKLFHASKPVILKYLSLTIHSFLKTGTLSQYLKVIKYNSYTVSLTAAIFIKLQWLPEVHQVCGQHIHIPILDICTQAPGLHLSVSELEYNPGFSQINVICFLIYAEIQILGIPAVSETG